METVTKMRLSKETFSVLKNFSAINSNILIKPGNTLKTVSAGMNIYAEAKVQEEFDMTIPIWDLNQFLGVVSMFNNPDLEFNDSYVEISNGRSSVKYYYSEESLLTYPKRDIRMPETILSFDLDEQDLNEIMKASNVLQVSDLKIIAGDGMIRIIVDDSSVDTSNSFAITVNEKYDGNDYSGKIKVNDVKFLPGSYTVELTEGIISKFTNKNQNLSYYISIDRK